MDAFHCAPAEHVRGANQNRIADPTSDGCRLIHGPCDSAERLKETQSLQETSELIPVFSAINTFWRSPDDVYSRALESHSQFQRCLAAKLDDYAIGLFPVHDV